MTENINEKLVCSHSGPRCPWFSCYLIDLNLRSFINTKTIVFYCVVYSVQGLFPYILFHLESHQRPQTQ